MMMVTEPSPSFACRAAALSSASSCSRSRICPTCWILPRVRSPTARRWSASRHLITGRITDDCPRCGWHGSLHSQLATIGGDWSAAVCDNCYADLHPDITVTIAFFSVRAPGDQELFAAIRQRTRSDNPYPDLGQIMTWQLRWEHTPLLADDARGNAIEDITPITLHRAEQITSRIARQYWPPDAAQLPWVTSAYPANSRLLQPKEATCAKNL
jgi:hypothetical protein